MKEGQTLAASNIKWIEGSQQKYVINYNFDVES